MTGTQSPPDGPGPHKTGPDHSDTSGESQAQREGKEAQADGSAAKPDDGKHDAWHPEKKPTDTETSPVMTHPVATDGKLSPGQTGHVPMTVDEHNEMVKKASKDPNPL